jgi:cellulose synthase/poly-beta-1,6-N-acetylglucosamine synthase-like glycosyltransferase/peptidoglycan/xylan/chitin deacetylase (PgdA/CDA1 family)
VVAALIVLAFGSVMLVNAYVGGELVPDHRHAQGSDSAVPREVLDGGPLLDLSGERPRSYSLPPRTIALTFDDGPDPEWTPRVAEVLRRHGVQATFFVVGARVAEHPALVRRLRDDGHELGAHSFTHADLAVLPEWRRRWEYSQTQLAIAGAAGVTTSLIRLPYSSSPAAVDNAYWPILREAGRAGSLHVLTDVDSRDWERPGVARVIANSTPEGEAGGVVLMHDAGGDRAQTVAALDRYLPLMKQRGYRFVTVSDGLDQAVRQAGAAAGAGPGPRGTAFAGNRPASASIEWRGRALVWTVRIARDGLTALTVLLVGVGVLTVARAVLLFATTAYHVRRRRSPRWSWGPPVTAPVSVIVPAYNERAGIAAAVRSLAGGDHPGIEVVVVDDGSTDGTADVVRGLGLPGVRVIRVPNGGKAAALNVGVAAAAYDLVVMVDGDTVFEPDSIRRLVQPLADPRVGAVAGNVKVGNRGSVVARWQHIEYVIGFNLDRRLYDVMQVMTTVPGAIGAYRRQALAAVGGVSDDTLAEDTDLTMALTRAGWRVVYEERARAWTEAPATLRQLWTQRYRWSYGTMQAMWKHRRAVIERGPSGRFGRLGLPMLALFQVALPTLAPLIDVLALYGVFFLDRALTAAAWFGMLALQLVTAVVAFRLDRESLRPVWLLPLQQFVYRQLMYLVVIRSVFTALAGVRLRWQKLRRTGEVSVAARRPPPRPRAAPRSGPGLAESAAVESGSIESASVSRSPRG